MEIPDLSLNSTFSIPNFANGASPPPPAMCNYTIHSFECGHKAEDHVDSSHCPEFQRTGVHCDRDNPANRHRVNVRSEDRPGVCNACNHGGVESSEIEAMEREIQRARELSLAEAKAHEEEMRLFEQRAREQSMAEAEKSRRAHEARIKELEQDSIEMYKRQMQKRELEDLEYIIRKSREEAEQAAYQAEMDMMQQAFKESLKVDLLVSTHQDEVVTKGPSDLGGGMTAEWTRIGETTITPAPPLIPPPPPPPPPPPAPKAILKPSQRPPFSKPVPPKVVDYSIPAMGPQNIGRFKIGTRSQPEHESQRLEQPVESKSPILPTSPSPFARLGGPLAPSLPAMREARGPGVPVPPAADARAGPRRSTGSGSGSGKSTPLPADPNIDPKLAALLAKRRTWEVEQEEASLESSITPSESASNVGKRMSSTNGGRLDLSLRSRAASGTESSSTASQNTGARADSWDDDDAKTLRARRLSKFDFDKKRQSGWGN